MVKNWTPLFKFLIKYKTFHRKKEFIIFWKNQPNVYLSILIYVEVSKLRFTVCFAFFSLLYLHVMMHREICVTEIFITKVLLRIS